MQARNKMQYWLDQSDKVCRPFASGGNDIAATAVRRGYWAVLVLIGQGRALPAHVGMRGYEGSLRPYTTMSS